MTISTVKQTDGITFIAIVLLLVSSLLLTNRKSSTGYRLLPKLMTLSDLECRNGRYSALLR